MILVVPMAGRGERFRQGGFTLPKPLIPVDGQPMFVRATNSLPLRLATRLVFAILQEHVEEFALDMLIQQHFASWPLKIVVLSETTSGQAETVVRAVEGEDEHLPLLIFNADSAFEDDLENYLPNLSPDVAGVLQVFTDNQTRWSFARCGPGWRVIETAEKRPVSSLACTGLYYFRQVSEFRRLFANMKPTLGETHIAPMYNDLIGRGELVLAKPVSRFWCFGTPEDYRDYQEYSRVYCYSESSVH